MTIDRAGLRLPAPVALAAPVHALPLCSSRRWAYEVKIDGWRLIAGNRLHTRHGTDVTAAFCDIADPIAGLPAGCVVDGEVVVQDSARGIDFDGLSRRLFAGPGPVHLSRADRAAATNG